MPEKIRLMTQINRKLGILLRLIGKPSLIYSGTISIPHLTEKSPLILLLTLKTVRLVLRKVLIDHTRSRQKRKLPEKSNERFHGKRRQNRPHGSKESISERVEHLNEEGKIVLEESQ